jgi:hypothetical protein
VEEFVVSTAVGTITVRLEPDEPTAVLELALDDPDPEQRAATAAVNELASDLLGPRALHRVVVFVLAADERTQRMLEAAQIRAVAVDGDDLVYVRRR